MGNRPSAVLTGAMRAEISLARVPVGVTLVSDAYRPLLEPFRADGAPKIELSVTPEELAAARSAYAPGSADAYIEFMELCVKASDALLAYDRAVFHGAAFRWRGKAWMLTAPSGTGKTTQYLRWKALCGADVQIINGDKPVLAFDGKNITVCPSPWNGKEGMGQRISAPLGGIILLRQSGENRIRRLRAGEAVGPVFTQFLFSRACAEDVRAVCRMEDRLLRQVPVWLLENRGDAVSAALLRETLMEGKK